MPISSLAARVPANVALYQEVFDLVYAHSRDVRLRRTAVCRLALLITGLIAARSCVVAQIAREVFKLGLTRAHEAEHVERRLRRTLRDTRLTADQAYVAFVRTALEWSSVVRAQRQVLVSVDDTSQQDHVHVLRIGLQYWGGTVPLAWAHWPQNVALPEGAYWHTFEQLLAQAAAIIPAHLEVVVLADRAFDAPSFIDRVTAQGWHYIVRAKTNGTVIFRDWHGREQPLRQIVHQQLPSVGRRWKCRGWVFKTAGWRLVHVLGVWAPGYQQRLVVFTDLPLEWKVLGWYRRRFWIEAGFRQDKRKGWQWESNQVRTVAYHACLLLAMAWASVVVLSIGVARARQRLAERQAAPRRVRAQHPRYSIFSIGLMHIDAWLAARTAMPLPLPLPELTAPTWDYQWVQLQRHQFIFGQTVRP